MDQVKFVFPTAPLQSYTPMEGEMRNVWFDRKSVSIEAYESRKSMAAIYETINEMIKQEIDSGIPPHRIVVGGFSMGGCLALHTGYHLQTDIGGIFAFSSFLNKNSIVYDSLENRTSQRLPPLRMFHGDK